MIVHIFVKKEIEAKVSGKVVMVMFRDFVRKKASSLDLTGTVENLGDGSVKVVAQGDEEKLKQLIGHLHKGPFLARVARVEVIWRETTAEMTNFEIIY